MSPAVLGFVLVSFAALLVLWGGMGVALSVGR